MSNIGWNSAKGPSPSCLDPEPHTNNRKAISEGIHRVTLGERNGNPRRIPTQGTIQGLTQELPNRPGREAIGVTQFRDEAGTAHVSGSAYGEGTGNPEVRNARGSTPSESKHRSTSPSATPTYPSSVYFCLAVSASSVNEASHPVRFNIEFTNRGTPMVHSFAADFVNEGPLARISLEPDPLDPRPPTSAPASWPGEGGDESDTRDMSSMSDEDSDSENELFFTPNTSPPTSSTSAFASQDTYSPFPHYSEPAFIPAYLRNPGSPSIASSFGPYVPRYLTPPIAERPPVSNGRARANSPNLSPSPSPSPSASPTPLVQITGCTITNFHTFHKDVDHER